MTEDPTGLARALMLSDLPPVAPGSTVAALPGLDRWTRGEPRSIALPRVGSVRLGWGGIVGDKNPHEEEMIRFWFAHQGQEGAIGVERALATRIVAAVLKSDPPLLERALGRAERGIVAAAIAETLRLLGSPWQLSLRSAPPSAAGDFLTVAVTVDGLGPPSVVLLVIPRAAWPAPPAAVEPERAAELATVAIVEVGGTRLRFADLTAFRPGDALVFDGTAALSPTAAWSARLRVGPNAAPATVDAAGAIRLCAEFRPLPIVSGRILRKKGQPMDDNAAPPAVDPTLVLAAAPIEIVAELGRLSVRGDEILSLARGGVLTFGGLRSSPITLRVGEEIWARGELCDVGGELGVRITELGGAHPARERE